MSLLQRVVALLNAERGLTSVGIAAFAGAFVLAGSLAAGVFVEGGLSGSEALDVTFQRALANVTTGVQVDAPVLARTDGARATMLLVDVTTTAGGAAVALPPPPDAADGAALRVRYVSAYAVEPDLAYTVMWLSGNGDALLEPGEVAQLAIDVSGIDPPLSADARFTLELHPGDGAPAIITRTMPAGRPLDPVVNLW